MGDYPRLKYRGADVPPGPYNAEHPGFVYQKVHSAEEEHALEGEWHDTPREAIRAHRGEPPAAPAPHAHAPAAHEPAHHAKPDHEHAREQRPRHVEEFPTESEKRKRGK